ncbi:NAD(P)/FAD-dependent oxidoreductase [Pinirhizobacter sp.]|jgi:flavin-dependent dehydrogenase|uniref:NAD(P)/FAD-dependent oxidoreductase n=1 Tax=Pinirhizobacter sp. TaxID=2950432 RepID=UPI002F3E60D3
MTVAQVGNEVQCDVAVIGGGPGGSTAAALLARRGYRVVVLEKARHPRFHIGESLLPMNLPLFERLGVLDKVRAIGVHKRGADFESDTPAGYSTFSFDRALGSSPPHAYQVYRQDLDQMLFEHARECGTDARDGVEVLSVEQSGPRDSVLAARADDGSTYTVRAKYVVDASGRDGFIATKKKLRRRNREHQSAAIFGHFSGAQFRPGEDAGNISIYRFEHGWIWMIPLPGGVMSVGAVCRPAYLKTRRGQNVDFFMATLNDNAQLAQRLSGATLIDNEVRVTGNYAYDATEMAGPGWILIGDAFAFLDPVFSSGVYLAMHGAEQAVDVIDRALRDPAAEAAAQRRMQRRVRMGIRRFAFFIYRFNGPVMANLFSHPRNAFRLEQGVISMLAGDIYDSRPVWLRLQMFKLLYGVGVMLDLRRWWAERRLRLSQAAAD